MMPILARIEDWLALTQMCRCVNGGVLDKSGVRNNFCCMRVEPGEMYCKRHMQAVVKLRKSNNNRNET